MYQVHITQPCSCCNNTRQAASALAACSVLQLPVHQQEHHHLWRRGLTKVPYPNHLSRHLVLIQNTRGRCQEPQVSNNYSRIRRGPPAMLKESSLGFNGRVDRRVKHAPPCSSDNNDLMWDFLRQQRHLHWWRMAVQNCLWASRAARPALQCAQPPRISLFYSSLQ